MKKKEQGVTTADIIVAVILVSVFITILLVTATNLTKNQTVLERQSQAMHYAIATIELAKGQEFSSLPPVGTNKIEGIEGLEDGYILDKRGEKTPYYRTVTVQDFTELKGNEGKQPEILKKVTVDISYQLKNEEKKVTLSTTIAKD